MSNNLSVLKDPETTGFLLATLSPSARKMIDMETWRTMVSSDEGDAEHILPLLFQCLITDMQTIGVTCEIDYDAISADGVLFFQFLNLCRLIMPNTLYPFLQSNDNLRTRLATVWDGSYDTGSTPIVTWLDLLCGHDGLPPIIEGFEEIGAYARPTISSDARFMTYLRTIEDNLSLSRLTRPVDPQRHTRYVDALKTALWRQVELEGRFAGVIPESDQTAIQNAMKRFTRDMVATDEIIEHQYLFLESFDTLPSALHDSFLTKWDLFRHAYPLFTEYYAVRKIPIGIKEAILCVYGMAITLRNENDYKVALEKFLDNPFVFTDLIKEKNVNLVEGIYE